jgi:hypothetical protein
MCGFEFLWCADARPRHWKKWRRRVVVEVEDATRRSLAPRELTLTEDWIHGRHGIASGFFVSTVPT